MKPLLVLDCYLDPFESARFFVPLPGGAPAEVVRPCTGECPPSAEPYSGILVGGSAASVRTPLEWFAPLEHLIRDAERRATPTLGVCFGHQIVAEVLLGPGAVRSSATPEIGWQEVGVLSEDAILAGFSPRFTTFTSHFDEVAPGLDGLVVLASSERCAVQAYRIEGRPIWGVQFHVEMDAAETERLVRSRTAQRPDLGLDADDLLQRAVDCRPLRDRLLENFLERVRASSGA